MDRRLREKETHESVRFPRSLFFDDVLEGTVDGGFAFNTTRAAAEIRTN
jgi:hypothetical protein